MYLSSHALDTELDTIWSQLSCCYQKLNRYKGTAEERRLRALIEMLRIEYRMLTSTYHHNQ